MKILLLVGSGSFLGGIMRYLLSQYLNKPVGYPWGTLCANLAGCLLIGFFYGLLEKHILPFVWMPFLVTGLLGGFTTFSAFSLETFQLVKQGLFLQAMFYVCLSIMGGIGLCALGFLINKFF